MPSFVASKKPLSGLLAVLGFAAAASAGVPHDDRLYFNRAPEKKEERLVTTPIRKSDDPIIEALMEQVMGKPVAAKSPESLSETQLPQANAINADVLEQAVAEP